MRYLGTEPLKLPVKMTATGSNGSGEAHDMSLPEVLRLFSAYEPFPNKFALTHAQIRHLNKGLERLEAEPEDGYYVLDGEEVAVFRLLLEQWAPLALLKHVRNVPVFLDLLGAAPEKKPEHVKEEAPSAA